MISQKSKYALRALLALARLPPETSLPISVIASRESIPKKFLEQILLELKRAGFVASRRGQLGGYLLVKRHDEITFGDVLRTTGGPLVPATCLANGGNCAGCQGERPCAVRRVFTRIAFVYDEILDNTTLADALDAPSEGLFDGWVAASDPINNKNT
ncbi:MAG: RrF2 family transcriptional regulator [Shinella sp.]|uniref:RrF2 family transcriptional regulator n=1 Tax=Shinella sp. TaxID=1870904 RepID=UPI00403693A4